MNKIHLNENHEKLCLNLPFVYHLNSFNCCFAPLVALSKLPSPPLVRIILSDEPHFVKILSTENWKRQILLKELVQKIESSGFALRPTVRKSDRVILLQNSFSENLTD